MKTKKDMKAFKRYLNDRKRRHKGFMSASEFEATDPARFFNAYIKWGGLLSKKMREVVTNFKRMEKEVVTNFKKREKAKKQHKQIVNQTHSHNPIRFIEEKPNRQPASKDFRVKEFEIINIKTEPVVKGGNVSDSFFNIVGIARNGSISIIKEAVPKPDLKRILGMLRSRINQNGV